MMGAGGVEVAQNVLVETQSAILPARALPGDLRWMSIAVALSGVAVTDLGPHRRLVDRSSA